jgi:hypothetical protein
MGFAYLIRNEAPKFATDTQLAALRALVCCGAAVLLI